MNQSPRERMVDELARRAADIGPEATTLDVVAEEIDNGSNLLVFAETLGVGRGVLNRYLKRTFGEDVVAQRLRQARRDGVHAQVDNAENAIRNASTSSREEFARSKELSSIMLWRASRYSDELREGSRVNVSLNFAQAHLDAMRQRAVAAVSDMPTLPAPVDVEIIEHDAA